MSEIEIYQTADHQIRLEVNLDKDTVWLSQKQMAAVFGTEVPAVNKPIKNILKTGELTERATVSKMEIVQWEGGRQVKRKTEMYNLDMIISVGYRVHSQRATRFRQWATQRLKDYLVTGYALNQQRLQQLQQVVSIIQQSGQTPGRGAAEAKGEASALFGNQKDRRFGGILQSILQTFDGAGGACLAGGPKRSG